MRAGRRTESAHPAPPRANAGRLSRSTRPSCSSGGYQRPIEGPIIPAVEVPSTGSACHIESEPASRAPRCSRTAAIAAPEDGGPVVGLQPLHDLGRRSPWLAAQHCRRRLPLVLADQNPELLSLPRRSRSASIGTTNAHAEHARACSAGRKTRLRCRPSGPAPGRVLDLDRPAAPANARWSALCSGQFGELGSRLEQVGAGVQLRPQAAAIDVLHHQWLWPRHGRERQRKVGDQRPCRVRVEASTLKLST